MIDVDNGIKELLKKIEDRAVELVEQRRQTDAELSRLDAIREPLSTWVKAQEENENGEKLSSSPASEGSPPSYLKAGSMTEIAYRILEERGIPLPMVEIFKAARAVNGKIQKSNFDSPIYRMIRDGKMFARYENKIGLLEWGDRLDTDVLHQIS